jgi:hypothetical protein
MERNLGVPLAPGELERANVQPQDSDSLASAKLMNFRQQQSTGDWMNLLRWVGWLVLAGVAVMAVLFVSAVHHEMSVNADFFSPHPAGAAGVRQVRSIGRLFPAGFKLPDEWALNWRQLKPLRARALHPETYEQDLCTQSYIDGGPEAIPKDLRLAWHVDAQGWCQSGEIAKMRGIADRRNMLAGAVATVVGLLCIIALGFTAKLLTRTSG